MHPEERKLAAGENDIREKLIATLNRSAKRLREVGLPGEVAAEMERLAEQARQPCVVAVVGRVKVGKSTFVNALLGGDHAKVGTTETTATINHFSYVAPDDPGYDSQKPVRCHWRGGRFTEESREFLDSLQGNDVETLRRAEGIERLEYRLPISYLRDVTLVDTPGTGAAVGEHVERTAEFMQLHDRLRERHDEDTKRLRDSADAVIYLLGEVAKAEEKDLLEEFARTAGGHTKALNAVGVLSKIELHPEVMVRRHDLAAKVSAQLAESLNTVVPVAAGLRRALDELLADGMAGLSRLVETLGRIPPGRLEMLLDDASFFCDMDFPDCPVPPEERRELAGGMPWAVFTTIAGVAADHQASVEEVARRLEEMTGFERLREVLDKHFIERGHILRCYGVIRKARHALSELRFTRLRELREESREEEARLERFVGFIREKGGGSALARELEEFVRDGLDASRRLAEVEALHAEIDAGIGALFHELVEYNADFDALQKLEEEAPRLHPGELEELRCLLGLYGGETEKRLAAGKADADYVGSRQGYWSARRASFPYGSAAHFIAERAFVRYGVILDGMLSGHTVA